MPVEATLRTALPVVMLVCAAGCAPSPPPAPPPAPEPAAEAAAPAAARGRLGTIVAIRPLAGRASRGAEFVVREDSGATVVVIQPHADGLAVGDRVALHEEARVRLTRAP